MVVHASHCQICSCQSILYIVKICRIIFFFNLCDCGFLIVWQKQSQWKYILCVRYVCVFCLVQVCELKNNSGLNRPALGAQVYYVGAAKYWSIWNCTISIKLRNWSVLDANLCDVYLELNMCLFFSQLGALMLNNIKSGKNFSFGQISM